MRRAGARSAVGRISRAPERRSGTSPSIRSRRGEIPEGPAAASRKSGHLPAGRGTAGCRSTSRRPNNSRTPTGIRRRADEAASSPRSSRVRGGPKGRSRSSVQSKADATASTTTNVPTVTRKRESPTTFRLTAWPANTITTTHASSTLRCSAPARKRVRAPCGCSMSSFMSESGFPCRRHCILGARGRPVE